MSVKLIGICGRKGSGKDTVADFIAARYGFEKRSLAGPIKDICGYLFDFNERQLEGDLKEVMDPTWGVSPRKVMQVVGTELFQERLGEELPGLAKDFWVRQLLKGYQGEAMVVSDIRFPQEAEALRRRVPGAHIIRVERPGLKNQDQHASERQAGQIKADYVLVNDGRQEDLYKKTAVILEKMLRISPKSQLNSFTPCNMDKRQAAQVAFSI